MAKARSRLRNRAEYLLVLWVFYLLAYLPLPIAVLFSRFLAFLYRAADRRHSRRVREQAAEVLGLDPAKASAFMKANYRHLGLTLLEFCRLARTGPEGMARRVDFAGYREAAAEALAEGKGAVFVTGHLGNWEWCGAALAGECSAQGSIARPLDNPYLNEFVNSLRQRNGSVIWDKQGAMRRAMRALAKGLAFGVLIDQDAGPKGWLSPFLGKEASTIPAPFEMAVRSGAPMLAAALIRDGEKPLSFRVLHRPARRPRPGADPRLDAKRLMDEINRDLGDMVMECPVQWLWMHRRWKTRDAVRVEGEPEAD